jgi:hypothetical protein
MNDVANERDGLAVTAKDVANSLCRLEFSGIQAQL